MTDIQSIWQSCWWKNWQNRRRRCRI